jgi:adenine-specific DNA methylase
MTELSGYVQCELDLGNGISPSLKDRGAFYTDEAVAGFLVRWAVRKPSDTVMDPSFGEGVFLNAAFRRLADLGGDPRTGVFGVEIDESTFLRTLKQRNPQPGLNSGNLHLGDFFETNPGSWQVNAIVGNPPFVRYQKFTGSARERALARARRQGVRLPALTSSWAPFMVHSASMVKPGGCLAMVAPLELVQARYAKPVLDFLTNAFQEVTILTFRRKLFPKLNEATVLVLADGKDKGNGSLRWRDCSGPEELDDLAVQSRSEVARNTACLGQVASCNNEFRFLLHCLPSKIRDLYTELADSAHIMRLGEAARAGIGYVTGANDYFHLTEEDASRLDIPDEFLCPAVLRGRALVGSRFTKADWKAGLSGKQTAFLLRIPKDSPLPEPVAQYVRKGADLGVPQKYKCRTRSPWYTVPHVTASDAFLTYMAGDFTKLASNAASAVAPNTLHIVKMHDSVGFPPDLLAAMWPSSLTRLSTEIEGHTLGGGMLKLEPREASQVLIPTNCITYPNTLIREIDAILRSEGITEARMTVNRLVLIGALGLSESDCELLEKGADILLQRRRGNVGAGNGDT